MLHYLIELAVAALIAYALGCCVGCLLRKWFGTTEPVVEAPRTPATKPVVTAGAAAVTAAAAAAAAAKMSEPRSTASAPTPLAASFAQKPAPVAAAASASVAQQRPAPLVTGASRSEPVAAPRPAPAPVASLRSEPAPASAVDRNKSARPMGLASARAGKADDLQRISGVGPKNEQILHSLGVYHFDQIAKWTPGEGDWIDDHMKFNGRVAREEWTNQARLLAANNESEFARLYGTGGQGARESGSRTARGSTEGKPQTLASSTVASSSGDTGSGGSRMQRPKGLSSARGGKADKLQRISGIGPKNEKILHGLGFYHFDQIAEWTSKEIDWVEDHLRFGGRIKREEWTKQSRLLADGNETQFAKLYGTGGMTNNRSETRSGSRTRKN